MNKVFFFGILDYIEKEKDKIDELINVYLSQNGDLIEYQRFNLQF